MHYLAWLIRICGTLETRLYNDQMNVSRLHSHFLCLRTDSILLIGKRESWCTRCSNILGHLPHLLQTILAALASRTPGTIRRFVILARPAHQPRYSVLIIHIISFLIQVEWIILGTGVCEQRPPTKSILSSILRKLYIKIGVACCSSVTSHQFLRLDDNNISPLNNQKCTVSFSVTQGCSSEPAYKLCYVYLRQF